jgi:hypothetical protein
MNSLRRVLVTFFLATSMALPLSAQAEIIEKVWEPILTPIPNDSGCGPATAFILEGMVHRKISNLRNGLFAFNGHIMATLTPVDGPDAGEPALFRENTNEVIPIFEEGVDAIRTVAQTVKIIVKGRGLAYRLNYNFHVTYLEGEVKSFFETEKVTCG